MANINLQCGHCGKTMAVEESSLGRQVRCPHCQQVVQTPASVPTQSWTSEPQGSPPIQPVPPMSAMPRLSPDDEKRMFADTTAEFASESFREPSVESQAPAPISSEAPWLSDAPAGDVTAAPSDPLGLEQPTPIEGGEAFVPGPASVKVRRDMSKWLIIFIVPLISYACLSSVAIGILWVRWTNARKADPFEKMLDEGEPMPDPDRAMPANLRQQLGVAMNIGGLEVTARRIERRKVSIAETEPDKDTAKEALVLHLHIKNVSEDAFKPLDFYFDRRWTRYHEGKRKPYTLVDLSTKNNPEMFFGGPLDWPTDPQKGSEDPKHQKLARTKYAFLFKNERDPDTLVVKQDHDRVLEPHTSLDTWVCTDGNDGHVLETLDSQKLASGGKYRWRVHIRRGLESVHGKDVWATAVIAFEFSPDDVKEMN